RGREEEGKGRFKASYKTQVGDKRQTPALRKDKERSETNKIPRNQRVLHEASPLVGPSSSKNESIENDLLAIYLRHVCLNVAVLPPCVPLLFTLFSQITPHGKGQAGDIFPCSKKEAPSTRDGLAARSLNCRV
ncbi:unnamed protein product, partial [Ectocarpus sp. 12 AP-2014]